MNLLVLGGTRFVGRHIVEAAVQSGHQVTVFHRGPDEPDNFPRVRHIHDNRDGGLDVLRGATWDAVIDTSGYVPRVVADSVHALTDSASWYLFISTISVYADPLADPVNEDAPLAGISDPGVEEVTGETYGALKVLCERAVLDGFPDRSTIVRPGVVVGPYDPTDRFTYWPHRAAEGGEMVSPHPEETLQFIDARDLAEFTITLLETCNGGIFNAVVPRGSVSFGSLLQTSISISGAGTQPTPVPDAVLLEHGITPWTDLPLWLPAAEHGHHAIDTSRAEQAGLRFRPLSDTVRDTLAWDRTRGSGRTLQAGIDRERERSILDAWRQRSGT